MNLTITDGIRVTLGIVLGIIIIACLAAGWSAQPAVQDQVRQSQYQACVSQAFAQGVSPFTYCGMQG